jgi:hypothetical protein
LISGVPQPVVIFQVQVSIWSVVTFWDQTSGEFGAGTGLGLRVRVMVSFDESSGARREVPFESVLRTLLVLAFVSLEIVSRVGFEGDGWTADGAMVVVLVVVVVVVVVSRRLCTI